MYGQQKSPPSDVMLTQRSCWERTIDTMPHRLHSETDHNPTHSLHRRLIATVATVSVASSVLLGSVAGSAQDGTSGAAPLEETNCMLVPASDIDDLRAGGASPSSPAATPVAPDTQATPVSSASPVAQGPASVNEDLLLEDLTASATSLMSCLDEGDAARIVDRTSGTFRGQLLGSPEALSGDLFVSLFETLPSLEYSVLEIGDVQLVDDTTATAEIVWQLGNQVRVDQWTFSLGRVEGLSMWTIEGAEPGSIVPSVNATDVRVTISDNRYNLSETTIQSDAVLFNVTNNDATDHELLVLRMEEGVTTDTLLTTPGPELPEGVTMAGQATIAANAEGRLLLAGLEPGTYTIVCLLPNENGVPYLAEGMEITFEVE